MTFRQTCLAMLAVGVLLMALGGAMRQNKIDQCVAEYPNQNHRLTVDEIKLLCKAAHR